jgi:hypothetical protein
MAPSYLEVGASGKPGAVQYCDSQIGFRSLSWREGIGTFAKADSKIVVDDQSKRFHKLAELGFAYWNFDESDCPKERRI